MNFSDGTKVLLGVLVTVLGWFVTYFLAKRKEDRTRRSEILKKHLETQITEFYGPMFNLVHQIFNAWRLRESLLDPRHCSPDSEVVIRDYFEQNFFIPLHAEMNLILKTRLYLVEQTEIPESFYLYLRHSTQEKVQSELWRRHNIGTGYVPGTPWPKDFYQDVREQLHRIMDDYAERMDSLR